jgi:hypothetical protein
MLRRYGFSGYFPIFCAKLHTPAFKRSNPFLVVKQSFCLRLSYPLSQANVPFPARTASRIKVTIQKVPVNSRLGTLPHEPLPLPATPALIADKWVHFF